MPVESTASVVGVNRAEVIQPENGVLKTQKDFIKIVRIAIIKITPMKRQGTTP